jgi:hypothetical protein
MMKRLSEKEWGEFYIGDLFSVSRPKARNKDDYIYGDVPFVASGAVNNGVMKCCKGKENEVLDAGNCLTVSPVDGSTFYQPMDFLGRGGAGSSILMLRSDSIQPDFGQFIARAVQQTCSKYSYGNMGNKDSINRERVMLPVDDKGKPDYAYMTLYSTEVRGRMLMRYKNFIAEQLSQLEYKDIPALDEKKWGHFLIPDVFSNIQRGKRLKNADHVLGIIPYVSSTANNNGVDDYVEATAGTRSFSDCISLANSGSVGTAFYEPFEFVASDHVTSLKHEGMSKFVYLFLTTTIERQGSNFNFNREINDARIKKMQVMLPVSDDGKPDYKYMEQYAKNMMLRKYEQYLAFIDRQSSAEEVNV